MTLLNNHFQMVAKIARVMEFKCSLVGEPILTVLLMHHSEQLENGQKKQVNLNIVAKIIGKNALICKDKVDHQILAKGFLQTSKLGFKNVVFHINEITEFNQ